MSLSPTSPTTVSRNTIPSSFRKPIQSSRGSVSVYPAAPISFKAKSNVEAQTVQTRLKNRFALMPQESEDSKITGSTRSLERRLLALNVRGSRMTLRNSAA